MAKIELVCWFIYQWIKNYFYFIFSCRRWSTWPHTDRSHEACQILTIKCSIMDPWPEPEPREVSRSHSNPGSSSNEILMDDWTEGLVLELYSRWCHHDAIQNFWWSYWQFSIPKYSHWLMLTSIVPVLNKYTH